MADYVEIARRVLASFETKTPAASVIEKNPEPELTKLTKPTLVSLVSSIPARCPIIESPVPPAVDRSAVVFPHCPRCASYALYRRNNIGDYECQTCGLEGISEVIARRTSDRLLGYAHALLRSPHVLSTRNAYMVS